MSDVADDSSLTVVYAIALPPRARFRVRQVLYALIHVQLSEPKSSVFVLNDARVPRKLFEVDRGVDVIARAREVAAELERGGVTSFCERYRIPVEFLTQTESKRRRLPDLRPLV